VTCRGTFRAQRAAPMLTFGSVRGKVLDDPLPQTSVLPSHPIAVGRHGRVSLLPIQPGTVGAELATSEVGTP
jgi:hypothetical protein